MRVVPVKGKITAKQFSKEYKKNYKSHKFEILEFTLNKISKKTCI